MQKPESEPSVRESFPQVLLYQIPIEVILPLGLDSATAEYITSFVKLRYESDGKSFLTQAELENRFYHAQMPDWGYEEERSKFETIENVTREYLKRKLVRLGLPDDHVGFLKPYYMYPSQKEWEKSLKGKPYPRGYAAIGGSGVIVIYPRGTFVPSTIPHELSHGSVGRTVVVSNVGRRKFFGRGDLKFRTRVQGGLPGVLEEGLATWDARDVMRELVAQDALPDETGAIQRRLERVGTQVIEISDSYKQGRGAAHELAVTRKIAGLLGYWNSESVGVSDAELVQYGRELLERMRYSRSPDKHTVFYNSFRAIKTFSQVQRYDFYRSIGHPKKFDHLLKHLKNAEAAINRKFY